MKTRLLLAAVLLIAAGGLTRAQDKPLDRAELDKRVVTTVYEAAVAGTKLFNDEKNYEGTFRLYQGTLLAVTPLLDHRPKLQATVKERLKRAAGMKAADGAFELRTALDEIQNDIAPSKKPLWDRLGGEKAVRAVVEDFVASAAPDPKVNFFRDGKYKLDAKGVEKLKQQLVELVSMVTGGPLKYTGRSMKESHKGMGITDAEFDALAGHLVATLKKFNVPQAEMDELVKIVASTRGDIVEKAPAKPVEPKEVKKPLWDRLGGEKAVKAVVHDFVLAAAPDPKVNFFRDGKYKLDEKGVERLEKLLVELISEVTGGPLKYTGKSMKESHKGMEITDAEFKALAGHLVATLKKYNVPQAEIDELVKIVATTYDDIVEKK
jgi:hemoglobin